MGDKEIIYKDYTIRIVPQETTGDLKEVFLRIFRGTEENTAFVIWEKISGTSQRKEGLNVKASFDLLEKEGIKLAKQTIDQENFKENQEFTAWQGE